MHRSLLPWIIVVHCVLLFGMFDVYFKSPIVSFLPTVRVTYTTPADRLVLFIGDGLRADHFFDTCNVPFLRNKIESGDALAGISRTRVPTESRPGTVAIAAGVYEDPSAVFKGWQDNPVPVDSFFNRCRQTFAWGSPDIVHLFSKNASNIDARSYREEDQSFDPKESLKLNQWVLDEFATFLQHCQSNSTCRFLLHQEDISFFFHFIGIDMAGHKSKPFSQSYIENIQLVDRIIEKIVAMFDKLFKDDKTTFIFTSDHGMTDWGSHGAGSKDETETPLVVWGAGVKSGISPLKSDKFRNNTSECSWQIKLNKKYDVEQADIAVLMSTLLGVEIPTNSMGVLPWQYLGFDSEAIVSALLLNMHQLLLLYHHLENITKAQVLSPFFRAFPSPDIDRIPLEFADIAHDVLNFVRSMINSDSEAVVKILIGHILLVKKGISYYQTYYQTYLLFLLSSSFLGLILIIAGKIYLRSTSISWINEERSKRRVLFRICFIKITPIDQFFLMCFVAITGMHLGQSLPISYYLYAVLPLILWYKVIDFWSLTAIFVQLRKVQWFKALIGSIILLIGIGLLYLSFFYRWVLSVCMVVLSAFPLTIKNRKTLRTYPAITWILTCLILSIFPLLPTVGVAKQTSLIICSGSVWIAIIIASLIFSTDSRFITQVFSKLTKMQISLLNCAIIMIMCTDVFPSNNPSVRSCGRLFSWCILVSNFGVLFFLPDAPSARLFNVTIAFGIPFLMLSNSFESLFMPLLTLNMMSWIQLEKIISISERRIFFSHRVMSFVHRDEIRKGFLYLFFIIFSFFGIGNIDSVNSFDINWVRCFIDVFSPFTMTVLIVLKTIMPFFLVACTLRMIVFHTRIDGGKVLLITIMLCEIMNLLFLFMIKNTGSWLDIGKSISHYVIMEVSSLCLVLLYTIAGYILLPSGELTTI